MLPPVRAAVSSPSHVNSGPCHTSEERSPKGKQSHSDASVRETRCIAPDGASAKKTALVACRHSSPFGPDLHPGFRRLDRANRTIGLRKRLSATKPSKLASIVRLFRCHDVMAKDSGIREIIQTPLLTAQQEIELAALLQATPAKDITADAEPEVRIRVQVTDNQRQKRRSETEARRSCPPGRLVHTGRNQQNRQMVRVPSLE